MTHESNIPVFQPLPKRFRGIPMPENNNVESIWETVEALKEVVEVLIGERGGGELSALLHRDYNPPVEDPANQLFLGVAASNSPAIDLVLPGGNISHQLTYPNLEVDTTKTWQLDGPDSYTCDEAGYYLMDVAVGMSNLSMSGGNVDFEIVLSILADGVEVVSDAKSLGSRELDSAAVRNVMDVTAIVFIPKFTVLTAAIKNTASAGLEVDREFSYFRISWLGKRPADALASGTTSVNQTAMDRGFSEGFTI